MASICLLFLSCTDLDLGKDNFLDINTFQSEEDYLAFAAPAYVNLTHSIGHNSLMALQEVSTDEICVPQRGSDWNDGGTWQRLHRHQWTPDDPAISNTWQFLYRGIYECNRFLYLIDEASVPSVPKVEAEIRALRALYYYWLLDTYGRVPLVISYDQDYTDITNVPRAEVFAFVENELLFVMNDLAEPTDNGYYGRIHKYVAKTILAKLYLNAVVYSGEERWQAGADLCNDVINSGKYSLKQNYFDNFTINNHFSNEIIFAIPFDDQLEGAFNIHMMTLHDQSQKTYNLIESPWNGWCAVEEFVASYENTDFRKGQGNFPGSFISGPQFDEEGDPLIDLESEDEDPDGPLLVYTPHISSLTDALRQEGARIGKFEIPSGAGPSLTNDFPVFRYADILLTKAECLWRLNREAEALVLVNRIRNRSNLDPYHQLTADNILAERGRELFCEMHRRTDLIRFGKFGESWWEKGTSERCKQLFPIPYNNLLGGSNLSQNECY